MNAIRLNDYKGKRVFRFPVKVTCGETAALLQVNFYPKRVFHVISHTAREARDWVSSKIEHIPCCEVEVFGPKGGCASHAYWGFDRAIFAQMNREFERGQREAQQMRLPLGLPVNRKEGTMSYQLIN